MAKKTKKKKTVVQKKSKAKKNGSKAKTSKNQVGKWRKHKFFLSPKKILSFTDLQIKSSSKLKDEKKNKSGKVKREGSNPTEITLTVELNAFLGIDVRKHCNTFIKEAKAGEKGYFYVGKKKLVTYKMMLTEATAKEVEIAHNNTWKRAQVMLVFKQAGKGSGGSSSGGSSGGSSSGGGSGSGVGSAGGGSNKVSVKSSSPVTSVASSAVKKTTDYSKRYTKSVDAVSSAQPKSKAVKAANSNIIQNTIKPGKQQTASDKGTSVNNFKLNQVR